MDPRLLDDRLNQALEEGPQDLKTKRRQLRRERIDEFENESAQHTNAYSAVLGASTADIARISEYFGSCIVHQMGSDVPSMARMQELEPAVRMLLRLRKSLEFHEQMVETVPAPTLSPMQVKHLQSQAPTRGLRDGIVTINRRGAH
jgi:3-methyladenine DNA glycosylase/8-oxoguanine DNA glycosylase